MNTSRYSHIRISVRTKLSSQNHIDKNGTVWIPLAKAASYGPYGPDYLRLLARQRKILARKMNDTWYTTEEALKTYVEGQADKNGNVWISLGEAASRGPYGSDYLRLLARQQKITARKINDVWY